MKQKQTLSNAIRSIRAFFISVFLLFFCISCLGDGGDRFKFKFLFKLGSLQDPSFLDNSTPTPTQQIGLSTTGGKSLYNQSFYSSKTLTGDYGFNIGLAINNIPDNTEFRICLNDADCIGPNLLYQGNLNTSSLNLNLDITIPVGFPVNLGANTLNLVLINNGQIIDRKSAIFIYDNVGPVLNFSTPTGTYTSQQNISITCNDPISGCKDLVYTIDGQDPSLSLVTNFDPLQIILGNSYSSSLSIGNGVTVVKVTASDRAGNITGPVAATYTINIAVPAGPIPVLTLNSVQNGITNQAAPTSINWTSDAAGDFFVVPLATDCHAITPPVTIASGNLGVPGTQNTTIPTAGFAEGLNQLKLCFLDSWNQDSSLAFNVTKDTIAPTLTSSAPINNAVNIDVFDRNVFLTFNETMQADTSIEFHAFITYGAGAGTTTIELTLPVSSSSTWMSGTVLKLDLDSILPEFTSIRVKVLASDLKDLAGNAIAGDAFGFLNLAYTTGGSPALRTIIDTNQPSCYNGAGGGVACAGSGQDGAFAATPVAQVIGNPTFLPGYAADPVTIDTTSGLTWKTCVQGMTWMGTLCGGVPTELNWPSALSDCNSLNQLNGNQGYAGLKNWRLAKMDDFHSLLTFPHATSGYTITANGKFPGLPSGNQRLWSSTTYRPNTGLAYNVRIFGGRIFTYQKNNSNEGAGFSFHALCVNGNP